MSENELPHDKSSKLKLNEILNKERSTKKIEVNNTNERSMPKISTLQFIKESEILN